MQIVEKDIPSPDEQSQSITDTPITDYLIKELGFTLLYIADGEKLRELINNKIDETDKQLKKAMATYKKLSKPSGADIIKQHKAGTLEYLAVQLTEALDFITKLEESRSKLVERFHEIGLDLDKFTCYRRIHELHYLFYSEQHKHFHIAVKNESGKREAGGGYKPYNKIIIPRAIYSTNVAGEVVNAITGNKLS